MSATLKLVNPTGWKPAPSPQSTKKATYSVDPFEQRFPLYPVARLMLTTASSWEEPGLKPRQVSCSHNILFFRSIFISAKRFISIIFRVDATSFSVP